jgi:hypothetical protein
VLLPQLDFVEQCVCGRVSSFQPPYYYCILLQPILLSLHFMNGTLQEAFLGFFSHGLHTLPSSHVLTSGFSRPCIVSIGSLASESSQVILSDSKFCDSVG